jgi:hypothetical protein
MMALDGDLESLMAVAANFQDNAEFELFLVPAHHGIGRGEHVLTFFVAGYDREVSEGQAVTISDLIQGLYDLNLHATCRRFNDDWQHR